MPRTNVDGIDLEYETRGSGEPIVFLHHGAGVDWFDPLRDAPALSGRFRTITYHRAGYERSGPLVPPLTFATEAATFAGFVDRLGVDRVHVVGHSASACIAIEIGLSAAERVRSLVLLEPALMAVPSAPEVPRALELYRAGRTGEAVDTFLLGTCGPAAGPVLDRMVPGSRARAVANAPTFFGHELPALRQWSFGPERARDLRVPVLAVLGETSDVRFNERNKLLRQWVPHAEPFALTGAGHLLHLENLNDMAEGLAAFVARHSSSGAP
jgi:pimeloyl-ACP methyl ester carboxylesterase